jgi:hypothetical protein
MEAVMKTWSIFVLGMCLILSISGAPAALPTEQPLNATPLAELLTNPGIESPYETLAARPECPDIGGEVAHGWMDNSCWEDNEHAHVTYAEDTDNPHGGASAQRIQVQDGIGQYAQPVPLQAGKLYTATIWMRAQTPTWVTLLLRKMDFPYTYYAMQTVELATTWAQCTLGGVTETTEGFFMILTDAPGTFWLDDASLTATDWSFLLPAKAVPRSLFGLHIHYADLPWPPAEMNVAAVRIWDADGPEAHWENQAQWAAINTAPGVYDWASLDMHVNRALANGADVVFSLGRTPRWASARPDEYNSYGPGQAAEPADDQYWREWVGDGRGHTLPGPDPLLGGLERTERL